MNDYTERYIQMRLYHRYFNSMKFILPNYTPYKWWECDMFGLTKAGYMREWEIKRTRADFVNDKNKKHRWFDWKKKEFCSEKKYQLLANGSEYAPRQFWYVVPEGVLEVDDVPEFAGFMIVKEYSMIEIRKAPFLHKHKAHERTVLNSQSVLYHRYWNEKIKFQKMEEDIKYMELG